jgi:predicted nucleic acid-binding protein
VAKKWIGARLAERALNEFTQAAIQRYAHVALLERIWRLRANLTAYDASYVALAELLGGDLLTVDKRLAAAPGILCHVEVL